MEYKRQVALRCDGEDFVVSVLPADEIVFRTRNAPALRKLCQSLRWQIAVDATPPVTDWTWPASNVIGDAS